MIFNGEVNVVSYRNSTSNHNSSSYNTTRRSVVSYRNSTSNHNSGTTTPNSALVVSYRNSTSNHNQITEIFVQAQLYLIEILHQTTTIAYTTRFDQLLYLIEILHQTTTRFVHHCCVGQLYLIEILHQTTTDIEDSIEESSCILSKFYIKPQPLPLLFLRRWCCILSKFYIKPQRYAPTL